MEDMTKSKKKTPGKPLVKCEQCRFKSGMIQMKLHIQNVHKKKPKRAEKRLPIFIPIAKSSKRSKSNSDTEFDKHINIEGINDESIFLISDVLSPDDINLEENVLMTGIFSCDMCNFDTELETELNCI